MPPKSATEQITKMLVRQAQLNKELVQAQADMARKERQHAEEVAAKEKKSAKSMRTMMLNANTRRLLNRCD